MPPFIGPATQQVVILLFVDQERKKQGRQKKLELITSSPCALFSLCTDLLLHLLCTICAFDADNSSFTQDLLRLLPFLLLMIMRRGRGDGIPVNLNPSESGNEHKWKLFVVARTQGSSCLSR